MIPAISLTVTDLDSFRRYRDEEYMTLEELLRRIRRQDGPSDVMRAGTALHSILEHSDDGEMAIAERDGFRFLFSLDAELSLLPFRELHGKRTFMVNGRAVEIRGKVDATSGLLIEDHKLSSSAFDAERYFTAYQWRAYLAIFGADAFAYNVFTAKFAGIDADNVHVWDVTDFNRLVLHSYPNLEEDLMRELASFVEFADRHLVEGVAA